MKLSLDLDGTVWKYPKWFSWLAKQHQASGWEVGILTAHSENIKDADLKLLQARCGFTPDFFICKDENTWTGEDTSDGYWKARMVLENDINIHYDDFDIMKEGYHEQYKKDFEVGLANYANYQDHPLFVVVI